MFPNKKSHICESIQMLYRAIKLLTPSAFEQIRTYIESQMNEDGGFVNRKGEVDLYYTVFGLLCSVAFDINISSNKLKTYLERFNIEKLSMVDLSCYVKCHAILRYLLGIKSSKEIVDICLYAMKKFQTTNNSFSYEGSGTGFPYAVFLAVNLYQDLEVDVPEKEKIIKVLDIYRTNMGGVRNPGSGEEPMLLSTVATINVIRYLTNDIDDDLLQWVANQYHNVGGFLAARNSQFPDMLSTAVSLFTLSLCGYPLAGWSKNIRQFIDDHFDDNGGFRASINDEWVDCEYTYYGLLALGSIQ